MASGQAELRQWVVCGIGIVVLTIGSALSAGSAGAQREPTAVEVPAPKLDTIPEQARTSATDVANAPSPEQATGVRHGETNQASRWLWVPRVVFFIPRWVIWIAVQPIRGTLWVFERYQLGSRVKSIFFNDEGSMGAYPLAFFETGFGLNIGARVIKRDFWGDGRLRLRASYGGRFRARYGVKLTSGQLLGDRAELEVLADYQTFSKSRFFGVGNRNVAQIGDVMTPIDAYSDGTALSSRYRHDDASIELAARIRLSKTFGVRLAGTYLNRSFEPDVDLSSGGNDILDAYDTSRLIGYNEGVSSFGGEAELVYDTRRSTHFYVSDANPDVGWKIAATLGYAVGVGDDPSNFLRYSFDVQRAIGLTDGARSLFLRAYIEGVTGDLDDVPFTELPRLGGPVFLRGYERDRFRDRVAAVSTVEYRYMVNKFLTGYLFADVGRVMPALRDFGVDDVRVGYGMGVQLHSATTFRARFDVSTSDDNRVFLNLSFDPVFDTSSRKETR